MTNRPKLPRDIPQGRFWWSIYFSFVITLDEYLSYKYYLLTSIVFIHAVRLYKQQIYEDRLFLYLSISNYLRTSIKTAQIPAEITTAPEKELFSCCAPNILQKVGSIFEHAGFEYEI